MQALCHFNLKGYFIRKKLEKKKHIVMTTILHTLNFKNENKLYNELFDEKNDMVSLNFLQ